MKKPLFAAIAGMLLASPGNAVAEIEVFKEHAETRGHLETDGLPAHLRDRGEGIPLSMFGTYIQKGQLIVYPFFEYYLDSDYEYQPSELGVPGEADYLGKFRATEELLFVAYRFSHRFAVELEGAMIQAKLETSPADPSALPDEIEESGLGDVEGQLRWRWTEETASRPEFFSYFETVFPTQEKGALIGTTDWELKLGAGLVRGYSWGTITFRGAGAYATAEKKFELGEFALEYLRRLSSTWRFYGGFEGTQDEVGAIVEAQWHFSRQAALKLNSGFGLTPKEIDWAPEVGVMFSF